MKTVLLVFIEPSDISLSVSNLIGIIVSLFLLCYLAYSLMKPEDF